MNIKADSWLEDSQEGEYDPSSSLGVLCTTIFMCPCPLTSSSYTFSQSNTKIPVNFRPAEIVTVLSPHLIDK